MFACIRGERYNGPTITGGIAYGALTANATQRRGLVVTMCTRRIGAFGANRVQSCRGTIGDKCGSFA